MSQLLCAAANGLWYLSCLPGSLLFRRTLRDVAGTQRQVLARLLRRNAATEFGRQHAFAAIHSIAEYQARVPLSTYDDYRESIERIGLGQPDVLTHDPVLVLELTGGSTGATRQIPYTAALKAEYGRAIAPWIANLYTHNPRLLLGQAYWSVTPVARRNERTPGGIPVGFEEDSEYFGALQRHLIQAVMAVPPLVRLIDDMEAFRYVTLLFLLRSRSLALISVWNPTFLTLLIGRLAAWWPRLVDDIARGTISAPAAVEPTLHTRLVALNRPDPRRAEEIRSLCRSVHDMGALHTRLWPNLRLISCWTDAHAGMHVPELARLFPQARVQGKGLLATEGVVSFPLAGHGGAALAIRSHFFEFLPVGGGPVALAHELE
ncbi:MAG: GH3 auxin-responsive promoter family protein, partial [Chloroflexota bacterium]|nr:GH3 auxin-responsive promoter family protein [Chloroflexota bacterium]